MVANTQHANDSHISEDMDSLRADVSALRADLKALVDDAGKVAGGLAGEGIDSGKTVAGKVADASKDATKTAENAVKDNPIAALGLAFGLGAILGFAKRK